MIVSEVNITPYEWRLRVFYAVTCYYTEEIMAALTEIRCPAKIQERVFINLRKNDMDTGFTYSNSSLRSTVMVIGLHSSPAQFLNSFEHELRHLVDDIAQASGLDEQGEDVAYLTGDLNSLLWGDIHKFVCCKCHCKKS